MLRLIRLLSVAGDALSLVVEPSEYFPYLVDQCLIKLTAVVKVKETRQFWSGEDDFVLLKPTLQVQAIDRMRKGRPSRIRLSFRNPLDVSLTKCRIAIGK